MKNIIKYTFDMFFDVFFIRLTINYLNYWVVSCKQGKTKVFTKIRFVNVFPRTIIRKLYRIIQRIISSKHTTFSYIGMLYQSKISYMNCNSDTKIF